MSSLTTSTPYTEDADNRQGRVAVESTPEEWFNTDTAQNPGGSDASVPYENEFAHSEEGDFVVMTRDPVTNKVVPKSASRDLRKKFEAYEKKCLFDNAEAFVFNSALNVLYFDPDRMTVKMASERVFSASYKYWAICGISADTGSNIFYTGIESDTGDGTIKTNLIETVIEYDTDSNPVGVTCSGHLIANLVHGSNYRVIFYDADMIQIDQMVFQAYNVRGMTFDVNPESAVKDIQIGVTGIANDTIELQQGQPWSSLALRLYLVYANGDTKDVTSEWSTSGGATGRVTISGLDDIDSSKVTADDEEGYSITVTYVLATTNVVNPLVDPDTLSIQHTYKVRIVANSEETIMQVIPSVWIEGATDVSARLCMKLFGINKDNNGKTYFVDHSYRIRNSVINDDFCSETVEVENASDPDKIYFKVDYSIASQQTFKHNIPVPYGSLDKSDTYAFETRGLYSNEYAEYTDPLKSNLVSNEDFETGHILKATLVNGTDGTTRLIFNKSSDHSSDSNSDYISYLKTKYSATINGTAVAPTHIRIRNGKNPNYWHTSVLELNESLFTNGVICSQPDTTNIAMLAAKTPVIVEFINKTTNADTYSVEKTLTALALYHVTSVTNN